MKTLFGLIAVSAVALTGCTRQPCTEYVDAIDEALTNYGEVCKKGTSYARPSDKDITACDDSAAKSCTSKDLEAVSAYSDCLSDLPACTTANKDDFEQKAGNCGQYVKDMSEDCGKILGGLQSGS